MFIGLITTYYWMSEHGYIDALLSIKPSEALETVKSIAMHAIETIKETIDGVLK
ncbi:MAG: hypothetical protein LRY50_16075 [Geovibrio sp.]|jgi:hypothetical protein|nr:hypothetical protein [Geovibrio sp.]MCD8569765.1 hypothetical protein [Geovibrio sp.]